MVLPFGQLYSNLTDKQKQEVKRTTAGAASQVVREGIELYRMFDEPTIEEEQSTEDFLEKLYTVTVGEENVERQQRGDREVVTITEPETTAGKVIRDISSFTASMIGVGKITKPIQGLKTIQKAKVVAPKTTSLASLTARGEIATQLSINPYEENLANMIGSMIDEDSEGWASDFERYMLEPIKSSEEKTELENRLGLLSTGLVLTGAFGVASSAITNRKEIAKPFIKTLQNIKEKGTEASEDFVNTVKKSIKLDESRFRKALRKRKEEIRKQKQQLSLFETDESSIALGDMRSLKEGLTSKFSTNKIVRNLSNFLAKTFTTRGGRSKMLHESYLKGKYTYEKWEATIDHVGRNLEEAIVNIHKAFGGSREDAWKKVDDILFSDYRVPKEAGYTLGVTQDQGFKKALETLPPSAREPLIKARELQDTLSRLLLESDSIPKAAKEKIKEGLGYYVRQSWRLHNDIGYIPTNKAYRDAEAFIEQEIKKQNPNISDDGLTLRLASEMELLAGGKGEFANFGKSFDVFDKLHSGLIQERVNIPPAIKAYLGEIESPTEKLLISMKKISKFVSDSDFHNKAWKDGKNIYFFNEKNQIPGFSQQIPKLAGDDVIQPYGDLSGKYTSPNLARYYTTKYEQGLLLETGSKSIPAAIGKDIWRSLLFLKSQSQKSKTVRRVNTHIKNVFGGAQISGANGFSMLNPKGIQKSFQAIKGQLSKNTDLENQKYIEKLAGFGILNKNAIVNDLKNLANEASQIKYNPLSRPANYLKNTTAGKKLLKFDEKAQDWYIAEDDFFKINMFETEQIHLNKFNKALPNNVKFDKYKYVDVEQESANITRNGLPNYDLVPENIKALRAVPFIGRFFSFLSESMRLGITIPNQAFKELALARTLSKEGATKASNIMLKRGIDRAAGYSTFAIGGGYAAANIANYAAGVGYDTINNIRPFLPKWMQNDTLVYSVDEDGTPMIYNVAPWDAFDFPRKPFQTAIHIAANRDLTESEQNQFWADFFVETLSPFFGESLTQEAINAYVLGRGKDSQGRLLKNPYNPRERFDDTGDTWLENITNGENIKILAMNLVEALEPGTITDFRRFSKTWGKEQTEFDQDIYPKQALARFLTGFGGMPFNDEYVENMYSFKVSNFRKKQSKRRSEIYLAIKDNSTSEIFIKQWLKANRKYYEDYEELHNLTEAAENLDISTFKVLKDAGVSRIDRISFMGKSRYFNPLSITEEMRLRILESDGLRNNYFDILKEINRQTLILKRLPVLVPVKEQLPKDKEVDKIFEETAERKRKFDGGEIDLKQNPVPNVVPEPSERINPYTGEPYEAEMERLGFKDGLLVSIGVAPVSEKQISKLKKSLKKRQAKANGGFLDRQQYGRGDKVLQGIKHTLSKILIGADKKDIDDLDQRTIDALINNIDKIESPRERQAIVEDIERYKGGTPISNLISPGFNTLRHAKVSYEFGDKRPFARPALIAKEQAQSKGLFYKKKFKADLTEAESRAEKIDALNNVKSFRMKDKNPNLNEEEFNEEFFKQFNESAKTSIENLKPGEHFYLRESDAIGVDMPSIGGQYPFPVRNFE